VTWRAIQATVERRDHGGDHDLSFSPNRTCSPGVGRSSRGYTITAGQEGGGRLSVFTPISQHPSRGK